MKKISIAMAGAWQSHAADFAAMLSSWEDCRIAAVWDADAETGRRWAGELGCRRAENFDVLLADPGVDAVVICTAPATHADLAARAARAGKHVYLEKPAAVTAAEAQDLAKAAAEGGVCVVTPDPLWHEPILLARDMAAAGEFGELRFARFRIGFAEAVGERRLPPEKLLPENLGGGCMMDLGYHGVRLLTAFLGRPLRVRAALSRFTGLANEDQSSAVYEFDGGRVGVSEASWLEAAGRVTFELRGTDGCFHYRIGDVRCRRGNGPWTAVPPESLPPREPYPLRYWADCIRDGRKNELYTPGQQVVYLKMLTAAYESARLDRVVTVE